MKDDTEILIPAMMTQTFDLLADPVTIVNKHSRIIHANPALARLCNVPGNSFLNGKEYEEVQSKLFEDEESRNHWKEQDKKILDNPSIQLRMLEIHPGSTESPFICTKMPLFNGQRECVGSVHHIKYLEVFRPNDFVRGRLPGSLLLNRPGDIFNERECEIIFLKLQGMTNRNIADVLYRSSRTIENSMQRMYNKAGVNHLDEFIDYCEKRDFHRYLPQKFLVKKRLGFDTSDDADYYLD
ncbi:helix-turn-helix transcriptional regulator [Erwiniaceae bacterium BAC15a-03b]|uniref:Helix-turn-helix transcriptional regulator n=1 Tax=Winslowiella arboricola TaxID=2978220 RepID=A0A9J6PPX4_9GAMM|nr:PAS and helix-turn-helix domain-containing protein [Winslowiella arboricola]MCU5775250.1 helix-turn-helix transcriptional regulator [Winslowiella arboricola]MCU5780353.1 helix-turn-helix transcriptional regulator [Winslowiella arboricola]